MSKRSAALLAEALKLSEEERAKLAQGILESLDAPPSDYDSMTEHEFIAELERRAQELRDNPEQGVPWKQVKDMR